MAKIRRLIAGWLIVNEVLTAKSMLEKIKQIFKKIRGWVALIIIVNAFMFLPDLYWYSFPDLRNSNRAVCGVAEEINYFYSQNLREIILDRETSIDTSIDNRYSDYLQLYDNKWPVKVSGQLSYSSSQKTFYLRDGIFFLPLNVSSCQSLSSFEKGETSVIVQGTVSGNDGGLLLTVIELHKTTPSWIQIIYSAGFWGNIMLFLIGLLSVISVLLQKLILRIGLAKPNIFPSFLLIKDWKAPKLLIGGIIALFVWIINPIVGALIQIFSLIAYQDELRAQKRKMAITGAILCVAGFIIMTIWSMGIGTFEKPLEDFNFYYED